MSLYPLPYSFVEAFNLQVHVSLSAIPPKVDDAFKNFRYVPYSSLTLASRIKAARREEDLVFNAQGGLTARSLDRRNEKSISTVDWHAAARAAEEWIRFHHGDIRADAFSIHHKLIMDLGRSHSWEIAMEYDIQQRDAVALNPSHDLGSLNLAALTLIATCPVTYSIAPPTSSPKRNLPSDSSTQTSRKRQRAHCFRCGQPDHFPADCKAELTISGRPTAKLAPTTKSKHAMLAPNGKQLKPHTDTFRMIQDMSYPRNHPSITSINHGINSDDFPTAWGTFNDTAALILSLPAGCLAATFDISAAYRLTPIQPDQQHHLCVFWKDMVYVD